MSWFPDVSVTEAIWIGIGFGGQFLFSMRFLYQWFKSEQVKRSVVPEAFWYFSFLGGVTLLAYAVHKHDPVFILGQASGLLIYSRNIWLIWNEKRRNAGAVSGVAAS
jgi:lipid-A-disaccharide synthase-like uncharacterized protein